MFPSSRVKHGGWICSLKCVWGPFFMQTLPSWSPLWPLGSTPHPLCTTLAPRWVFTGPNSRFTAEHTALPLKLPKAQQSAPLPCPSLLPPTGACQGLPCSPPTSVFLCGFSTIIIIMSFFNALVAQDVFSSQRSLWQGERRTYFGSLQPTPSVLLKLMPSVAENSTWLQWQLPCSLRH